LSVFITAGIINYLYSYRGNHKSSFGLTMRSAAKHLFHDY